MLASIRCFMCENQVESVPFHDWRGRQSRQLVAPDIFTGGCCDLSIQASFDVWWPHLWLALTTSRVPNVFSNCLCHYTLCKWEIPRLIHYKTIPKQVSGDFLVFVIPVRQRRHFTAKQTTQCTEKLWKKILLFFVDAHFVFQGFVVYSFNIN